MRFINNLGIQYTRLCNAIHVTRAFYLFRESGGKSLIIEVLLFVDIF